PAGQTITQVWNANANLNSSAVTATNVSYNGTIATGANASFGFNGSWNNSSNPAPTSFTLNGTACTGSAAPTTAAPTTSRPPTSAPPTTTGAPPTSAPPTTGAAPSNAPPTNPANASSKQLEDLNRGVVSVRSGSNNFVSWRMLGWEPASVSYNLYRGSTKVNASPITNSTNYLDSGAAAGSSYTVRAVVNGVEQTASEASMNWGQNFLDVPISPPAG